MTWRMTSGNLKFSAHNGGQEKKSRGRGAILSESEKKRRRKVLLSNINETRIYIGSEIGRWNELRDTLEGKTHMETARFLLDHYESTKLVPPVDPSVSSCFNTVNGNVTPLRPGPIPPSKQFDPKLTSTPGTGPLHTLTDPVNNESFGCRSGVEEMGESDSELEHLSLDINMKDCTSKKISLGSSFLDPFSITVDMSEPDVQEKDSSDEDYEPSITINLRDEDVSSDKCESSDSEEESDEEFPELYVGPGVNHITSANDVNDVIQNVFMVFEDQLLSLANTVVPMTCTSEGCLSRVKLSTECVGSALYIHW